GTQRVDVLLQSAERRLQGDDHLGAQRLRGGRSGQGFWPLRRGCLRWQQCGLSVATASSEANPPICGSTRWCAPILLKTLIEPGNREGHTCHLETRDQLPDVGFDYRVASAAQFLVNGAVEHEELFILHSAEPV